MNTVIYFFITKPGFQEKCDDDDEKSGLRRLYALHTCESGKVFLKYLIPHCFNQAVNGPSKQRFFPRFW